MNTLWIMVTLKFVLTSAAGQEFVKMESWTAPYEFSSREECAMLVNKTRQQAPNENNVYVCVPFTK